MITPSELAAYVTAMREAGVTGPIKIDGIEMTLPPAVVVPSGPPPRARSAKADYDAMLFACTEGIPEDEVKT